MTLSVVACAVTDSDSSAESANTESSKEESLFASSSGESDDSENNAESDPSDESSDISSDISDDISSDVSNDESTDTSDESSWSPAEEYPAKNFKDCDDFYETEKERYTRLLNPKPLNEFFEIKKIVSTPSTDPRRSDFRIVSAETKENDLIETIIEVIPDNPSYTALTPVKSDFRGWDTAYSIEVPISFEEFLKKTCCYRYTKEGIDVFLVPFVQNGSTDGNIKNICTNVYVCCEIDGYIFSVCMMIGRKNSEITIAEEDGNGKLYDRWRTEEEYAEIESNFEDAKWKYELLNIYHEKSEFIACLKEIVAEQNQQ